MKKLCKRILLLPLLTSLSCSLIACRSTADSQSQINEASSIPNSASITFGETNVIKSDTPQEPILYAIYEPFGLDCDSSKNELYFEGELVRYFYDGVDISDDSTSVYCEHFNKNGTIDIHTLRETIKNTDGSIDPFGNLIGIEPYSQEEFLKRDLSVFYDDSPKITYASGSYDPTAESFTELFEKYKNWGIEYVEAKSASGAGNVFYNNQRVNTFIDLTPNDGIFSFSSADGGEFNVQTIYDKEGKLAGIEKID